MDCLDVLVTQWKWLANVILSTVTDICPINAYTLLYLLFILIAMPVMLLAPFLLLLLVLNGCAHIYGRYYGLMDTPTDDKAWDKFRYVLYSIIRYLGRLCHGYEVEGMENVPAEGGALFVAYHGPTINDMLFLDSEVYLQRHQKLTAAMHRNAVQLPGLGLLIKLMKGCDGSRETCIEVVKDGRMIVIMPGGTYEDTFGDNRYQLLWKNRVGYARVAIAAKSPIIPVFTVNIREIFRSINIPSNWRKILYEKLNITFVLYYSWFPVKLRTVIGQPIPFDPTLTAEELNQKVLMAMEKLIKDNQRLPGSVAMALLDRFKCQKKSKVA